MKKTNIIALLVSLCILLTIMLSPALAAKKFSWPMFLPAITGGISLPPGTLTYPKTGDVLVRYDRTDSTDWIEIIGTEVSGKPSEPVTRIRGNVSNSSFTLYYTNKKLVRFIYDIWTMEISYDADGNLSFTLEETKSANQLNTQASVQAVTVDCSKSKEAYQSEFNRAKDIIRITMNIFAAMIQKEGGDPETWLALIFHQLNSKAGFRQQVAIYSDTKEILARYDEECTASHNCRITYSVMQNVHYERHGSDGIDTVTDSSYNVGTFGVFEGSIQNNKFSSSYTEVVSGHHHTRTATVIFSSDMKQVLSFSMTHLSSYTIDTESYKYVQNSDKSINGVYIERKGYANGHERFGVDGATTCNKVTFSDYTFHDRQDGKYTSSWTTTDYTTTGLGNCDVNSSISIELWNK